MSVRTNLSQSCATRFVIT